MKKLLLTAGTATLALLFATQAHAQTGGPALWSGRVPHWWWEAPPPTSQTVVRRKNVPTQRAKVRRAQQR